jgi:predicted DCC family thiol-disulfide oxidoreductase YuxK
MNGERRAAGVEGSVSEPIVLFDGVCNFCNAGVNFLIDHDARQRLRFAALQSATGQRLLRRFGLRTTDFDTLVLVEGRHCYLRSTAALRIAAHLEAPWRFLVALLLVPTFLRDCAYEVLARNRYRWFGRSESCRVPTPELRQRFLD